MKTFRKLFALICVALASLFQGSSFNQTLRLADSHRNLHVPYTPSQCISALPVGYQSLSYLNDVHTIDDNAGFGSYTVNKADYFTKDNFTLVVIKADAMEQRPFEVINDICYFDKDFNEENNSVINEGHFGNSTPSLEYVFFYNMPSSVTFSYDTGNEHSGSIDNFKAYFYKYSFCYQCGLPFSLNDLVTSEYFNDVNCYILKKLMNVYSSSNDHSHMMVKFEEYNSSIMSSYFTYVNEESSKLIIFCSLTGSDTRCFYLERWSASDGFVSLNQPFTYQETSPVQVDYLNPDCTSFNGYFYCNVDKSSALSSCYSSAFTNAYNSAISDANSNAFNSLLSIYGNKGASFMPNFYYKSGYLSVATNTDFYNKAVLRFPSHLYDDTDYSSLLSSGATSGCVLNGNLELVEFGENESNCFGDIHLSYSLLWSKDVSDRREDWYLEFVDGSTGTMLCDIRRTSSGLSHTVFVPRFSLSKMRNCFLSYKNDLIPLCASDFVKSDGALTPEYNAGYGDGVDDGYKNATALLDTPSALSNVWSSVWKALDVQLLPGISLAVLVFLPVLFCVLIIVVKLFKGGS
jgi:hypothetical protein